MHVDAYRVPKIPPFWGADPELWFLQVEATFEVTKITVDKTKAHYLVASVESEVLPHIKDILSRNPPPENLRGDKGAHSFFICNFVGNAFTTAVKGTGSRRPTTIASIN